LSFRNPGKKNLKFFSKSWTCFSHLDGLYKDSKMGSAEKCAHKGLSEGGNIVISKKLYSFGKLASVVLATLLIIVMLVPQGAALATTDADISDNNNAATGASSLEGEDGNASGSGDADNSEGGPVVGGDANDNLENNPNGGGIRNL
jgi:hypothetical protein